MCVLGLSRDSTTNSTAFIGKLKKKNNNVGYKTDLE